MHTHIRLSFILYTPRDSCDTRMQKPRLYCRARGGVPEVTYHPASIRIHTYGLRYTVQHCLLSRGE